MVFSQGNPERDWQLRAVRGSPSREENEFQKEVYAAPPSDHHIGLTVKVTGVASAMVARKLFDLMGNGSKE